MKATIRSAKVRLLTALLVLATSFAFAVLALYAGSRAMGARAGVYLALPYFVQALFHGLLSAAAVLAYTVLNNRVQPVYSNRRYPALFMATALVFTAVFASGYFYIILCLFSFLLPLAFRDRARPLYWEDRIHSSWFLPVAIAAGAILFLQNMPFSPADDAIYRYPERERTHFRPSEWELLLAYTIAGNGIFHALAILLAAAPRRLPHPEGIRSQGRP